MTISPSDRNALTLHVLMKWVEGGGLISSPSADPIGKPMPGVRLTSTANATVIDAKNVHDAVDDLLRVLPLIGSEKDPLSSCDHCRQSTDARQVELDAGKVEQKLEDMNNEGRPKPNPVRVDPGRFRHG